MTSEFGSKKRDFEIEPRELAPLPDSAKRFIDDMSAKERAKLPEREKEDPKLGEALRNIYEFEDKYVDKRDLYSIEIFRVMHLHEHWDDSICALEIDDATLLDIVWTEAWDVRTLAKQIAEKKIVSHNLLPYEGRNTRKDFKQLKIAVKKWQETYGAYNNP